MLKFESKLPANTLKSKRFSQSTINDRIPLIYKEKSNAKNTQLVNFKTKKFVRNDIA